MLHCDTFCAFRLETGSFPCCNDFPFSSVAPFLSRHMWSHMYCADSTATVLLESKDSSYELICSCCKCQLAEDKALDFFHPKWKPLQEKDFFSGRFLFGNNILRENIFFFCWCQSDLLSQLEAESMKLVFLNERTRTFVTFVLVPLAHMGKLDSK